MSYGMKVYPIFIIILPQYALWVTYILVIIMRIRDFEKDYNVDEELENFLHSKIVVSDLKSSGWTFKEGKSLSNFHIKFNDLNIIITNPNFYNDGEIIAHSRKSIIQASGHPIVKYKNKEYWDIGHLIRVYGDEAIKEMDEWEWIQICDWIIVSKKDNNLLAQFESWDELPTRKDVEK
tara:strand:+ start:674 stop:1207 length:534 start_codon:yes stop_codon:yes gene_type:complete